MREPSVRRSAPPRHRGVAFPVGRLLGEEPAAQAQHRDTLPGVADLPVVGLLLLELELAARHAGEAVGHLGPPQAVAYARPVQRDVALAICTVDREATDPPDRMAPPVRLDCSQPCLRQRWTGLDCGI